MVLHFMAKSNQVVPKKGRGRPATGRDPVTAIRLSAELRATVDKWAAKQDDTPGRSEAIRRLVELGLKAKEIVGMVGKRRPGRFNWKNERELIAMAVSGATASEIAAKFKTSVKTIERKARALGIRGGQSSSG